MTTKRLLALSSLAAAAPAFAAPFLAIGENAELFVTANTGVSYTDNLLASSVNEEEDVIFTFTPGVELQHGKNSVWKGTASAAIELTALADNDTNNAQLAKLNYLTSYEGARVTLKGNAGYNEFAQNSQDLAGRADLTRYDETTVGGSGEYGLTEKTALGLGLNYKATDYKEAGLIDNDIYAIPLNVYYSVTPKLDLSAGYEYRNTDVDGAGIDTENHYFNVGARGEFTPKLTGSFSVGFNKLETDNGGQDDEGFGLRAGLAYALTAKTGLTLDGVSDFETSASGDSIEKQGITFGANTAFADDLRGNVSVGYTQNDYQSGREDDTLTLGAGVSYIVNENLTANLGYTFEDNDSNVSEYTKNTISLSASFRY